MPSSDTMASKSVAENEGEGREEESKHSILCFVFWTEIHQFDLAILNIASG